MDRIAMIAALVAIPLFVLIYLGYQVIGTALRLFRSGLVAESLGLIGITIVAASLVGIYASEKTLLVVGMLSWMYLAATVIRLALRQDEPGHPRTLRFGKATEDQDPNSMSFSGVGPGSQGFGLYAGGVRIAHDSLEDD
jgi:hypothetical protein